MRRCWNHVVFLELRRDPGVTTGISGFLLCRPWGKPDLPFELRGRAGGCARVTAGQKRPHLGVFPGPNIPLREDRDLGVAFQTHPGSQASSQGEAKDSALLPSRDADLLEPTEWPQGSQASFGVWREDSGFLFRSCRKEGPHFTMTGASRGFSRAAVPEWGFSRDMMGSSGSLSCCGREA